MKSKKRPNTVDPEICKKMCGVNLSHKLFDKTLLEHGFLVCPKVESKNANVQHPTRNEGGLIQLDNGPPSSCPYIVEHLVICQQEG
jgi:hypothetical protein